MQTERPIHRRDTMRWRQTGMQVLCTARRARKQEKRHKRSSNHWASSYWGIRLKIWRPIYAGGCDAKVVETHCWNLLIKANKWSSHWLEQVNTPRDFYTLMKHLVLTYHRGYPQNLDSAVSQHYFKLAACCLLVTIRFSNVKKSYYVNLVVAVDN